MFILGLTAIALGSTIIGLDHQPLNRGDLAWIHQDRDSSFLLSEEDRLLNTPSFWIGRTQDSFRYQVGLSARLNTEYSSADVESRSTVGGIRIETDVRHLFNDTPAFAGVGIFGTIPISSISSTGYTEEEQEIYDEIAQSWRSEIRNLGARISIGAETEVLTKLYFGLRLDVSSYWSWLKLEQSGWERDFTLKSEPIVYLGIAW
ncbi:MAG: hypothetical protein CMK59_07650 [Proteobacteria bacterium]|nr:hypothetical protein [Pseudomonadota bacterium]